MSPKTIKVSAANLTDAIAAAVLQYRQQEVPYDNKIKDTDNFSVELISTEFAPYINAITFSLKVDRLS